MLTIAGLPNEENVELPDPTTTSMFIKIIPHPDSGVSEPIIIPLESRDAVDYDSKSHSFTPLLHSKPWAPFRSREDFEYTETAVKGLLNKDIVNAQLSGLQGHWATSTPITLQSYGDMEKSLVAARQYGVQVRSHLLHSFN